jgi:hypothetical protein
VNVIEEWKGIPRLVETALAGVPDASLDERVGPAGLGLTRRQLVHHLAEANVVASIVIAALGSPGCTLLQKDVESERKMSHFRIQSLEEAVAQQVSHAENLAKQLDEAKKQVQDIAIKAIEGASGAKALAHINQIAMEQAKPRVGQG